MKRTYAVMVLCGFLPACESLGVLEEPSTAGELNTGYNYIPVDPLEITVLADGLDSQGRFPPGTTAKGMQRMRYSRCVSRSGRDKSESPPPEGTSDGQEERAADVMDALPDHTVRMAVRDISGGAEGGFGPVAISAKGRNYQVIVDSIFADTADVRLAIKVDGPNGRR